MRRLLILAATVAVVTASVPLHASGTTSSPAGVLRGNLGRAKGPARVAAERALSASSGSLGIDAGRFRFETVRRSIAGTHVRGREYRGGVPIDGTYAAVHVVGGRVRIVEAHDSGLPGAPVRHPIPRSTAVAAAAAAVAVSPRSAEVHSERLLVARGDRLVDTRRVWIFSLSPAVGAVVDVDSSTARVLKVADERRFADPQATIFDPNPIVATRDASLREPGVDQSLVLAQVDSDLDSEALDAALVELPVRDADPSQFSTGKLLGPWVDVQGPLPLGIEGDLNYTRADPRFETTMAYVHLDRVQRYFQKLGFSDDAGINAEPQNVYTLPIEGYDNSFYQPGNDIIVYGHGGVDDAEDAEVILHEYGHAVQDAQVDGFGASNEGGAMGEGFGDFLAGAYFARTSGGFQDLCVADWDATSYSSSDPACLRRLDSPKVYPKDIEDEVHADGEMWSAFLWRVRSQLGSDPVEKSDRAIRLVLASHEFLGPDAGFAEGIAALRDAAKALGHPEWVSLIDSAADQTHMPR